MEFENTRFVMCVPVIRLLESQTTHFIAYASLSIGIELRDVIKYFRASWYNTGIVALWESKMLTDYFSMMSGAN